MEGAIWWLLACSVVTFVNLDSPCVCVLMACSQRKRPGGHVSAVHVCISGVHALSRTERDTNSFVIAAIITSNCVQN